VRSREHILNGPAPDIYGICFPARRRVGRVLVLTLAHNLNLFALNAAKRVPELAGQLYAGWLSFHEKSVAVCPLLYRFVHRQLWICGIPGGSPICRSDTPTVRIFGIPFAGYKTQEDAVADYAGPGSL
jgi:hypothetical protein